MTTDEFITISKQRGYATKARTKAWLEDNPKADYTEDDLQEMVAYLSQIEWHIYDGRRKKEDE